MVSHAEERRISAINASNNKSVFPDAKERFANAIQIMEEAANLFLKVKNERMQAYCKGWIAFWKARLFWIAALDEESVGSMMTFRPKGNRRT